MYICNCERAPTMHSGGVAVSDSLGSPIFNTVAYFTANLKSQPDPTRDVLGMIPMHMSKGHPKNHPVGMWDVWTFLGCP